jgi:large subunit ribosomal protein L3
MSVGLVGRKCGMTRIFRENGDSVPVTVIEALPNRVTTVKTAESDGYSAVQVTVGAAPKANRTTKAEAGHFAHTKVDPGRGLYEFRLGEGEGADLKPGAELKVDLFKVGQYVDVSGTTKGKGYAGVIKRHNFSHQTPGRVFPGKRMAGRLGADKVTKINLEVVKVDAERNLLLVKGAVPGSENGQLVVRPAVKIPAGK